MISMATSEPQTIYATMWDFRRQGWTFRSGGAGSGIFKSTDGGEHWAEINPRDAQALPEKPYGPIPMAVAAHKPQVVCAMSSSTSSSLYRPDDACKTWKRLES